MGACECSLARASNADQNACFTGTSSQSCISTTSHPCNSMQRVHCPRPIDDMPSAVPLLLPAMPSASVADVDNVAALLKSRGNRKHRKPRGIHPQSENEAHATPLDASNEHAHDSTSVLHVAAKLPEYGSDCKGSANISRDSTVCGSSPGSSRPSVSTNPSPRILGLGRPTVSPHLSPRIALAHALASAEQPCDLSPGRRFAHSADKGHEVEQLMRMVEVLTHKVQRLRLEESDPACVSEMQQPETIISDENEQGPLRKVYERQGTPYSYPQDEISAGSVEEGDMRKPGMAEDIPASCPPWGRRNTPAVQCEPMVQSEAPANLAKKTKKHSGRRHSAPADPKRKHHRRSGLEPDRDAH